MRPPHELGGVLVPYDRATPVVAANHQLSGFGTNPPAWKEGWLVDSTKPAATVFDALKYGLWRRFIAGQGSVGGALLNTRAWNAAAETGDLVGDCRVCGHHLRALPTVRVGRVDWYSAECINCRHEFAAPNGEILLRSSRHAEQPAGFAAGRPKGRGV